MNPIRTILGTLAFFCGTALAADSFGGIGVTILSTSQGVQVVDVVPGSPSAQAGLQPQDLIVAVNGQSLAGLTLDQCKELLRGPAGSELQVSLQRFGQEQSAQLQRAALQIQTLEAEKLQAWFGANTPIQSTEINYFAQEQTQEGASFLAVLQNGRLISDESAMNGQEFQSIYIQKSHKESPKTVTRGPSGVALKGFSRQAIQFELQSTGETTIRLLTPQGQNVFQKVVSGQSGLNIVEWNIDPIPMGHYSLRIDQQQAKSSYAIQLQ